MYMYTLTPFCPSADNNAIGATLWRTESHSKNRETLLEEMKSVLQTPLPPTVFSLTEDSDNEKKKKQQHVTRKIIFTMQSCHSFTHPHSNICFCNSKHHESKWINSLALGLHRSSCYFKEQQLNNQPKGTHWTAAETRFYHSAWILTWTRKEKELDRFQEEWQP